MRTLSALALLALAAPLAAQQDGNGQPAQTDSSNGAVAPAKESKPSNVPPITIARLRPNDRRGLNVFEPAKEG